MRTLLSLVASLLLAAIISDAVKAESRQYCVACKDPDQIYICQVDTPHANVSDKGLQLYCIIRTSKDGGHRSCTVQSDSADGCAGTLKTYSFQGPTLSPELRSKVDQLRNSREKKTQDQTIPPQKGGEPETLIDMTGKVGKAARGVGKGVTKAAGKVGSATKKTGSAVGSAAKTAYDCMKSLFKECGSKTEDEIPESSPPSQ